MKRITFLTLILGCITFTNVFSQTDIPLINNIKSLKIVDCIYVKEYQGETYRVFVQEDEVDKYRIAILTLAIEKEAGQKLKIASADITLHYLHGPSGSMEEVAPCDGVSLFSTTLDVDRTLSTSKCAPGWRKMQTGTRTTASSTVYVDVAFRKIEPDISKIWLCLANPIANSSTTGWTP